MANLAIDIVVVPPEEIMDRAMLINQELIRHFNPKIILDKKNCLPHISLLMGCTASSRIPQLQTALQSVAAEFSPLDLTIESLYIEPIPSGEVSLFDLEKTPPLQSLHERIVTEVGPLFDQLATVETLYPLPEPEPLSLTWINGFRQNSTFAKFSPHMTLGFGQTKQKLDHPIHFRASRLAICHLGNYCTCRNVLGVIDL